jgi:F0F1-type ATP synthase assembly protein I
MEGTLRKKGSRVNMWSSRRCVLQGSKLILTKKSKDEPGKRIFVIMQGCFVSDIREISHQKRSLYEFRLHWPEHVSNYGNTGKMGRFSRRSDSNAGNQASDNDSDDEEDASALAKLADKAARTAKHNQKNRAAEVEKNEIEHQSLVSKGATLAGVAVGGVVIGALTAGVGLVPYLTLVGAAVVAGGAGVAYTASQAPSSKLVLAAESEVRQCVQSVILAHGRRVHACHSYTGGGNPVEGHAGASDRRVRGEATSPAARDRPL